MGNSPAPAIQAFEGQVRRNMGRVMIVARWLMAPIYLVLLLVPALIAVKSVQELVTDIPLVLAMSSDDLIHSVLSLVDLALVANLVVIVIYAGWANFVGPLLREPHEQHTTWASNLDFSAVKLKLVGSIAAIAAIQMLESFVHIDEVTKEDTGWQLAILLGIGVTGVLLAVMDRLGSAK